MTIEKLQQMHEDLFLLEQYLMRKSGAMNYNDPEAILLRSVSALVERTAKQLK